MIINIRYIENWKTNLILNMNELENSIFKTSFVKPPTNIAQTTDEKEENERIENRFRAYEFNAIKGQENIATGHDNINPGGICYLNDRQLIATGGTEGTIKFWHAQTKACVLKIQHDEAITKLLYLDMKGYLLVGDAGAKIASYQLKTNKIHLVFKGHQGAVNAIDYLKDYNLIASGGIDKNIKIWENSKGTQLCELYTDGFGVGSLVYIKSYRRLAAGL